MLSDQSRRREPMFNMPGPVVGFLVLLVGIQAARLVLSQLDDLKLVIDFGFVPAQWSVVLGTADPAEVARKAVEGVTNPDMAEMRGVFARYVMERQPKPWSVLTYTLLHGSWLHVTLNCVWFAAFGTPVARRLGGWRFLGLGLATAIGGALAHLLANRTSVQPMIGASAIVSGVMAAAAVFVFEAPGLPGRTALGRLLANRTALLFLGSWFVLNIALGLAAVPLGITESGIAWEAHIGGLLVGLLLFPLLDPVRRRAGPGDSSDR